MILSAPILLWTCCLLLGPVQTAADEGDYGEEIVLTLALEEDAHVETEKKTTPGVFHWSNKVRSICSFSILGVIVRNLIKGTYNPLPPKHNYVYTQRFP